jgi:peptide-methionine (S)-S-oxide reductase
VEIFAAALKLSDAQLAIAREHGFRSWARLKAHVESPRERFDLPYHERIQDPIFRHAVGLLDAGDAAGLREQLRQHPKLVRQRVEFEGGNYFHTPTLLEFIAENPVRNGTLPRNIVDVAKVILDAGPARESLTEALGLVATGRVVREYGVQVVLIELLCDHGADPDGALQAAAAHGEFEAVEALLRLGARISLPVAAALGRLESSRLLPAASDEDRQRALALASQFGRLEVVRMLLNEGVNPNRYNLPGSHSHSTPLHQAAFYGHQETVQQLIERGADPNEKDLHWNGTPADWARHGGHAEIEAYLRERETATTSMSGTGTGNGTDQRT